MKIRHFSILLVMILGAFSSAMFFTGGAQNGFGSPSDPAATPTVITDQPFPDAYKMAPRPPVEMPVPGGVAPSLTHPCGGMLAEPTFSGISPLAIAYVPGMCGNGYGDIAVWQANGHSYVAQSGFAVRMFHLWNVDDPYNPQILITQPFPSGGTASTALFHFTQTVSAVTHQYMAVTMRGSGTGCGYFIYNVDDPSNPVFIVRKAGADWCTVHETFVSTDTNGSADYAWLTMSGESGSGYKVVALTLPDLSQPNPVLTETGRYQRPDSCGSLCIFAHDSNVVGNRVFVAHWLGGMLIFDKETLAHTIQPAPLNPIDSIRPDNFQVHHTVPTTDGRFAFIEDEFINSPSLEKVKVYNISDINNPVYAGGIIGSGNAASSQAHNMILESIGPNLDRLYVAWYKAGMRIYEVETSGATPVITEVAMHQLRAATGSGFGGVWGVDHLPCTLHGQPHTCVYSSDYEKFGLVVDALGYDPSLDPYAPASVLTDPINNQQITGCTYTLHGTAHDYYSGVQRVEVSLDGGTTWQIAQGTDTWSYNWTIPGNGTYSLKVRAVDVANNVETPVTTTTVIVSGCTGAETATPTAPPPTNTAIPQPTNTSVLPTNTPIAPTNTVAQPPATSTSGPPENSPTADVTSTAEASATATSCPIQFTDVPVDNVFYVYIRCVVCRGIMSGYDDGTFRPFDYVTRGQASKMVSNAVGYDDEIPTDRQTFEDVAFSNPFWIWIERLMQHGGIISGYECGGPGEPCGTDNKPYFRPFGNITRGQISKVISNAAGYEDTPADQTFTDVDAANPFYMWVERIAMHGAIGGYQCGSEGEPCDGENRAYYRPYRNLTRAQLAKIIADIWFPNCVTPARP